MGRNGPDRTGPERTGPTAPSSPADMSRLHSPPTAPRCPFRSLLCRASQHRLGGASTRHASTPHCSAPRCLHMQQPATALSASSAASSGWLLYTARVLLAVSLLAAACACGWWLVWRTVLRKIPLFQEVLGHGHHAKQRSSQQSGRRDSRSSSAAVTGSVGQQQQLTHRTALPDTRQANAPPLHSQRLQRGVQ